MAQLTDDRSDELDQLSLKHDCLHEHSSSGRLSGHSFIYLFIILGIFCILIGAAFIIYRRYRENRIYRSRRDEGRMFTVTTQPFQNPGSAFPPGSTLSPGSMSCPAYQPPPPLVMHPATVNQPNPTAPPSFQQQSQRPIGFILNNIDTSLPPPYSSTLNQSRNVS